MFQPGFSMAMKRRRTIYLFLACLAAIVALYVGESGVVEKTYEYTSDGLASRENGAIVDDLANVEFICLVGERSIEAAREIDGRRLTACPTIDAQGIVVGRPNGCVFYELVSQRVLDEYDAQCREDPRELEVFDRYGVPTLVFADRN